MGRINDILHAIIAWVGKKSSLLNFALIVLIIVDVFQRYLLNKTFNWVLELEWHFFGLIFLLGSAWTFQEDKHVRVDVFYTNFSERTKAWINLLGTVFLLIPWCVVGIITCYKYAANSFYIREGSPSPGGLPAWYVIKFAVVLGFVLLVLQGLVYSIHLIKSRKHAL
jgi:TRAP-type mannitol/chloroaromatic compound transport system permease small subunit